MDSLTTCLSLLSYLPTLTKQKVKAHCLPPPLRQVRQNQVWVRRVNGSRSGQLEEALSRGEGPGLSPMLRSGNGLSSEFSPNLEEEEASDSVAKTDTRTAEQRGKLGVAIAAGNHEAHGANRSGPQRGNKGKGLATNALEAMAKGDLKALGGHAVAAVRTPLSILAGGSSGQSAAMLKGQTFNLSDLDPDADGDGVVSAFEKAVYERIQRIDKDGDGKLSIHELYDVVEEAVAAKQARAGDRVSRGHSSQRCARRPQLHPTQCAVGAIYAWLAHAPRACARAPRHTTRLAGQEILQDALPRHCRRRGRPDPLLDGHHGRPHVYLQRYVHQPRRRHAEHLLGKGRHVQ